MKVAVAGASGFVGKALIDELKKYHDVIALSRSSHKNLSNKIEWRACDLFSLLDAENALHDIEIAIYLVHSMRPSAHLTQGTFEDFDLIVADNFARAAQKTGVKQIIYLGGMRPPTEKKLSQHLQSRAEVEAVFRNSSVPTTVLRAAIILGSEGSSFHIMARLVDRLPIMVCPAWTRTKTQPVALQDIVHCILYCVANTNTFNHCYDVGGPQSVSYKEMMYKIAKIRKLKRHVLALPLVSPQLSTLWVCLITGAPKALVRPLVMGLRFTLLVDPKYALKIPGHEFMNIDKALIEAIKNYDPHKAPLAFQRSPSGPPVVRSVQRLQVPTQKSAENVAQDYLRFLTERSLGLLKVEVNGNWIYFCLRFPKMRLLTLEYTPERSWANRQLFYVRGGLLAKKKSQGRLEFRKILGEDIVLAAIHDFEPRLPWYIYRSTQAFLHLWVMKRFALYLNR